MSRAAINYIAAVTVVAIAASPFAGLAATKPPTKAKPQPFYYAGWLPFWKQQPGALDVALNLEKFNEVSPFSYEVGANGKLVDKLKINEGLWPGWIPALRDAGRKVIPTIAWFNGTAIHSLLSSKTKRLAHENAITKLVVDNRFDGIDIDYESKKAETINYFSTFLQGLAIRLHPKGKVLSCTVEARMPVSARRYKTGTTDDYKYANDYAALNKYCDQIRIMAYDQGVVDSELDALKGNGAIYAPVADTDWAEKVIKEALKSVSPRKLMLGIPTYGYEFEVSWAADPSPSGTATIGTNGVTTYKRLRSHTYDQAVERAALTGATPVRSSAGELNFSYVTSTAVFGVSPTLTWTVTSTMPTALAAVPAGTSSTLRYVAFSDAESAAQKIILAKKYNLRGVVFFKWDGEQDPKLWDVLK